MDRPFVEQKCHHHFMGEDTHVFLVTNLKINFLSITWFGCKFSLVLCYNLEPTVFGRSWDSTSMSWDIGVAIRSRSLHLCYADTQGLSGSLNCVVNFTEPSGSGFPLLMGEAAEHQVWSQTALAWTRLCQLPAVERWLCLSGSQFLHLYNGVELLTPHSLCLVMMMKKITYRVT